MLPGADVQNLNSSNSEDAGPKLFSDSVTAPYFVGPAIDDEEIDGMELLQAAGKLGVSSDEIWRRIRNGLLIARTSGGRVYVYKDLNLATSSEFLPTPPGQKFDPVQLVVDNYSKSAGTESRNGQEIALLIDHLSLAKEENREILRLTNDSMARLTQLTDTLLEMKDSMLASKDEQIAILKQKIIEKESNLTRVLKDKEDLETLTKILQNQ